MSANKPKDESHDLRREESDSVWSLLARAPLPEPDAWFTARALARCRHEGPEVKTGLGSLTGLARMWRWALGGGMALSMVLALVVTEIHSEKADKQKKVQEAFEIVASIDTDSDSSSSSSWQDSSL